MSPIGKKNSFSPTSKALYEVPTRPKQMAKNKCTDVGESTDYADKEKNVLANEAGFSPAGLMPEIL